LARERSLKNNYVPKFASPPDDPARQRATVADALDELMAALDDLSHQLPGADSHSNDQARARAIITLLTATAICRGHNPDDRLQKAHSAAKHYRRARRVRHTRRIRGSACAWAEF
jgi:hypothetical protein